MSDRHIEVGLDVLVGKTIHHITGMNEYSPEVKIITECEHEFIFTHLQDCCEDVSLVDFELGCDDFSAAVIVSAKLETNESYSDCEYDDYPSQTWSFYKIETTKGEIWMRWLGKSNGYYSESVDFLMLDDTK